MARHRRAFWTQQRHLYEDLPLASMQHWNLRGQTQHPLPVSQLKRARQTAQSLQVRDQSNSLSIKCHHLPRRIVPHVKRCQPQHALPVH